MLRAVAAPLGMHLEFQHVERILQLVNEKSARGPFSVPGGSVGKSAGKSHERLCFHPENLAVSTVQSGFTYALPVPGRIVVSEIQTEFHATLIPADAAEGYNPQDSEDLMDARLLARKLQVAELARRRPLLARAHESSQEDQAIAAGTASDRARAQSLAGNCKRR